MSASHIAKSLGRKVADAAIAIVIAVAALAVFVVASVLFYEVRPIAWVALLAGAGTVTFLAFLLRGAYELGVFVLDAIKGEKP